MLKKSMFCLCSFLLLVLMLIGGCSPKGLHSNTEKETLKVVTTISILGDLTENIVGHRGKVSYLVPIGKNPENYELLPGDLQKISDADVFVLNGWSLEEVIERSISNFSDKKIVYLTEGIIPIPLAGEDAPDPHAWFDIRLVISHYIPNLLEALVEIDPGGADEYRKKADNYIAQLEELDAWIKEQVKQIPEKNRVIIISENALKYYGEAYGFQTEGIWELNSHEEGTPQQISRIIDLVKEHNLPALFVESTIDNRYMNMISSETGVPIAGKVYTDALGLPGSGAETYIKMMQHNTEVLVNGLSW